MNLLELQQRANVLVQKVNEYEASLTGTEIDETDTLNQHKYADLYCLRPVMKLLFGADANEKLSRTLDNDVNLRAFASSAPAWNSTFNLLSYRPDTITLEAINNTYTISGFTIDKLQGNTSTELHITDIKFPITGNLTVADNRYSNYFLFLNGTSTTNGMAFYSLNALYLRMFDDARAVQLTDIYNRTGFIGTMQFSLKFWLENPTDNRLTVQAYNISYTYQGQSYHIAQSGTGKVSTGYITSIINPSGIASIGSVYITNPSGFDVDYQSDRHEFMNNIDMYNQYNMCQLDVTQNSITSKTDRVRLGINNSYSSNIADALVTESQVANIFNWNTTSTETIINNTMSVNRQVPGIVCYYLGNNYNSTYTATIPYAPQTDNINSINYGNPPYYGAFYRSGTDISESQVGLSMGAEACRIFMPGLNYTRGKLESPQQIWQPDRKIGDDNINLGFNWQGRAIYHELVFKNRRAGCSDADVDFIPGYTDVPDNDPQGLATRFALAQQKPYYYNRPWFNELDSLYGLDASKLADYIIGTSETTGGQAVFNKSKFIIVGSANISDEGILGPCSETSYVQASNIFNSKCPDNFTIYGPTFEVLEKSRYNSLESFNLKSNSDVPQNGLSFLINTGLSEIVTSSADFFLQNSITKQTNQQAQNSYTSISPDSEKPLPLGTFQEVKHISKVGDIYTLTLEIYSNGTKFTSTALTNYAETFQGMLADYNLVFKNRYSDADKYFSNFDLSTIKIVNDDTGEIIWTPLGITSMNDEEFYKTYRLDYDTWAKALGQ